MNIYHKMALVILLGLLLACSAGAAPFAYITNTGDNTVSVIDIASNTVIKTVNVGRYPFGVASSQDGTRVYVANQNDETVSVIDTATNTVIKTVLIKRRPWGLAVNPAGTQVFVTSTGSTVAVIDTTTYAVTDMAADIGSGGGGVAVNPEGTKLYVAIQNKNLIKVIDLATSTVTDVVIAATATSSQGVAVNPAGTLVYVTSPIGNTVSVIDTASNTLLHTVPVGWWPYGIAVNPAGTKVYVSSAGSRSDWTPTVSVIDTATDTVTKIVYVGTGGVAISPDGTRVYVANSGGTTVSVIDAATDTFSTSVPVGTHPMSFGQFISTGSAPPPPPSLSVERVYAFPPETEMFMNYSVYALIQNPLAVQGADATVYCMEDDTDPQGFWGDHLVIGQKSQQKTINIPWNSNGLYEFKYAHSWNWLGTQADPIFNIITDNLPLGNEILEVLADLKVPPLGYALEFYSLFDRVMTGGYNMKYSMVHSYTLHSDPPLAGFSPVSVTMNVPRHKANALVGYWVMQPLIEGTTGAALITVWAPAASLTFAATQAACIFAAEGMKKIAVDPDMDYRMVVQRKDLIMPEVEEISGSSPENSARDMLAVVADINALSDTLAKYDGAITAGDSEWMMIHLSKASEYSDMTVKDLSRVELSLEALIQDVRSQNIPFTDADVDQAVAHLSSEGLPAIEVEMLKRMHYSDESLAAITDRTARGIAARRDNILQYDTSLINWIHSEEAIFTDLTNALNKRLNEGTMQTEVKFEPGTVNLNTPPEWISAFIEIPGQDVKNIDTATVRLEGIPASEDSVDNPEIGNWDNDGYEEIHIRFPFDQVRNILSNGENTLTITGLIGDTWFLDRASITVTGLIDPPVAAFTGDPLEGVAPLTVQFTDRSVGAEGWNWAFGDGGKSEKQGPSHTYTAPGTYTVVLTVRNDEGSDTRTRFDFIRVTAPAVGVPVRVKIVPRIINLASKGSFVAFVRLPDEYETSGVLKDTVTCGGAPAERIIRSKRFPHVFGAIFRRDKLENVQTGDKVTITLEGKLAQDGETIEFSGTDTIRVINRRNRIPDELEDVSKVVEEKLFDMYGKENP
jgi:YVTN family beta-propeller protein